MDLREGVSFRVFRYISALTGIQIYKKCLGHTSSFLNLDRSVLADWRMHEILSTRLLLLMLTKALGKVSLHAYVVFSRTNSRSCQSSTSQHPANPPYRMLTEQSGYKENYSHASRTILPSMSSHGTESPSSPSSNVALKHFYIATSHINTRWRNSSTQDPSLKTTWTHPSSAFSPPNLNNQRLP